MRWRGGDERYGTCRLPVVFTGMSPSSLAPAIMASARTLLQHIADGEAAWPADFDIAELLMAGLIERRDGRWAITMKGTKLLEPTGL